MATKNGTGAAARPNSPQERPREGVIDQERAWLAGVAWLQSLTQDEREAAFASIRIPSELEEPPKWEPDAERVSLARDALFQALQTLDLLIDELDKSLNDESPLHLSLSVRVRELADAADALLTPPEDFDEEENFTTKHTTKIGTISPHIT